jgi:hypothetical protein
MRNSTLEAAITRVVAGALALLAMPCALALSLGEAAPQSSLGQPLRVAVPISAGASQTLTAACVHVIADAAGGGGTPRLLTSRVTIDRGAAGPQLVVTTGRPVSEPVVRLAVQAGCEGTTRRDYVLLLDPPSAGAKPVLGDRGVADRAATVAAATHSRMIAVNPAITVTAARSAPAPAGATITPAVARTINPTITPAITPTVTAVVATRPPMNLLSSPGGSSFLPEASAAGLPRPSSSQSGLPSADAEPPVAPWWPLAAALLVVGALARWLVPMRRRSAMDPPTWVTPTARTEPNHSISGRSLSRTASKPGYFAAMTEPGTGFPRGASHADPTTDKAKPASAVTASMEDARFASFDADLIEEQTIREEWAKAVTDGAIDMGGDSILKAIDDAEREIQGPPSHPAQVALDRSLDDELLPNKSSR